MKNTINLFLIALTFGITSCEKVINVDLKDAESRIIIEGMINNSGDPARVMISKSVPFGNLNNYPPVTGAVVKITDNSGNNFTLTESAPGIYSNTTFIGVPDRTYTLNVVVSGQTYTSVCKMPQPVNLDSLFQDTIIFTEPITFVSAMFTDPAGFGNYYQFIETINGKRIKTIFVLDDSFQDGGIINNQFIDEDAKIKSNDSIQIEMRCIDKNVYRYLRGLQDLQLGGTVPANPESNISNNALGYFSAYTTHQKTIVIY